jgi:pimeloyl-ACP methyl ester carboxylesterase
VLIDLVHVYVRQRFARLGIVSKRLELLHFSAHYYESQASSRPTLVLLHGLGTSSSTWIHVLPRLANKFHVIAIDLPGFGFSSTTGGKHPRYDEALEFLKNVIPRLVRGSFVLIGHSLGGWLAADYAIQSPSTIQKIILINPAGIFYEGVDEQRHLFNVKDLSSLYRLLDRLWWKYPWYFKPFGPAIFSDLRKRGVPEFVQSIKEEHFLNSRLHALTPPVHLVWGKGDNVISEKTVEVFRKEAPKIKTYYLTRCGHVPQLERPEELISILDKILDEEDAAGEENHDVNSLL